MDEIKNELLELGFNPNSKGIVFWVEIIQLLKEDVKRNNVMNLYIEVAAMNNTKWTSVERALRHSILPAKEKIKEKYKYDGRISNSAFINIIRLQMI